MELKTVSLVAVLWGEFVGRRRKCVGIDPDEALPGAQPSLVGLSGLALAEGRSPTRQKAPHSNECQMRVTNNLIGFKRVQLGFGG